jgi:hypothetical protein
MTAGSALGHPWLCKGVRGSMTGDVSGSPPEMVSQPSTLLLRRPGVITADISPITPVLARIGATLSEGTPTSVGSAGVMSQGAGDSGSESDDEDRPHRGVFGGTSLPFSTAHTHTVPAPVPAANWCFSALALSFLGGSVQGVARGLLV